jgi:hypothetical protein
MGRDEAITAIEPALAPSLERRIGNDHIAPENEVTRPRVIPRRQVIRELWVYVLPVSGFVRRASNVKPDSTLRTGSRGSNSNLAFPRDLHSRSYLMNRVCK